MKVGIVLSSLQGGGSERLHIELAKEFLKSDLEVDFILLNSESGNTGLHSLMPNECKIISLNTKRIRSAISPMKHQFNKGCYDILMVAQWPLTIIASIALFLSSSHAKIIFTEHTNLSASRKEELKIPLFLLKISISIFYKFADHIITVSEGIKNDLNELGVKKKDNISVIYNPVSIKDYTPLKIAIEDISKYWEEGFANKILAVGSLKRQKNFLNLVEAFSRLPDDKKSNSQVTILGEGNERQKIQEMISNLNLQDQIILRGFKLDPRPWFDSANLFVLSSSWEGFGNVLVEAMQSRLPIVSTDCPSGPREILAHGEYGALVEPDNPELLSLCISEALDKSYDLETIYKRSQEFTIEKAGNKYLTIFQKLI